MADVIAFIALIVSVLAFIFSVKTNRDANIHNKKKDTIDAFNTLQCQALDKLNNFTDKDIERIATYQYSRNIEEKKQYREISGYMARIEHFCVGVVNDIYDEEIVHQLAHDYFEKAIKRRIQPMLSKKNTDKENYYKNTERVFEMLENHKK